MRRVSTILAVAAMLLVSAACGRQAVAPRIDRAPASVSAPVAVPAAWAGAYQGALRDGIEGSVRSVQVADSGAAATAVREGRALMALTRASDATGLAVRELETVSLAVIVPLTFPVEELSAGQARDIADGRLQDWRALGGPAGGIRPLGAAQSDVAGVREALGVEPSALGAPTSSGAGSGWVRFDLGGAPGLGEKALRVDGALPGAAAYPLVERRVVAGRSGDSQAVDALARSLVARLASSRPDAVVLDAVGDIMLGRGVGRVMAERGATYPFEAVQPALAGSDVRFGNLELPLTERGSPAKKDYTFRAPPSAVAGLTYGGFNLVSVANNHLLDYGPEGLIDTIATLDRAGIAHAGAGAGPEDAHAPAMITVRGLRIALLAYVNVPNDSVSGFDAQSTAAAPGRPGVAWGTADAMRRDVAAAKARADVVIVSMHSGFEYTANANAVQRELAHAAIEAGAALVLGSHPHVLQGVEFYRNAPIIYSLGNFIFDLDDDDRRQPGLPSVLSVIFRVTLDARGVRSVGFLPAIIDQRDGRPVPVGGGEARPVLERLYRLTDALNGAP